MPDLIGHLIKRKFDVCDIRPLLDIPVNQPFVLKHVPTVLEMVINDPPLILLYVAGARKYIYLLIICLCENLSTFVLKIFSNRK